ncbi:uncharacterized protein LOC130987522 [Salvia miltiorrhiza]|uniref:uncharacterized protein LOC130987522 n=1 Tax=Salvia miltiorrhiza TaxID=226208 RepID=UPI0025AC96B5|nr:uncharacterized protein LOC130987522 [Salvia miltiorrhiza]XP_057767044.1 uncharacterized protein LOC130987522 [Salvia miltiorrhiza]XP_057767045.1 uncharacterized protein LOC130987522 [Salvia miltiorrhiza]XP_057767046.1 uncharacterized protein LOC130987522 [Salvia miltiorrhiza]
METHGSIANDLYSNILESSSVDLDRRSTTIQVNDNFHESDPADLWYDDDSCEDYVEKSSKAPDMDREWRRRRVQFHTLGYRDGVIAGKEAALQEGFNIGFKDSVLTGYNWGLVRGISSAMASLPGTLKEKLVETEETLNKFQQLHESVQCISSTESLKLFYEDQKKKSLKQETAEPSSTETNQSSDAGALENYHVLLQSILHESPLVEGHLKTML